MNTSEPRPGERVSDVSFTEDTISVDLFDGRTITVPLAWYPRLLHASPKQLQNWKIAGGGYGIHWPDLDEDLSTQGLLQGAPAPRKASKAAITIVQNIKEELWKALTTLRFRKLFAMQRG